MEETFLIRCDANKNNGFGHFSRCLNLARGIKHKLPKAKIVFLGDYDNIPTQLIEKYKFLSTSSLSGDYSPSSISGKCML